MPSDGPPKPLVLKPGQRAGTAVAWRNTYDDIRRPPVTVALLRIASLVGWSPAGEPDGGFPGRIIHRPVGAEMLRRGRAGPDKLP